jgi:methyl-accepting chemotaxis protein
MQIEFRESFPSPAALPAGQAPVAIPAIPAVPLPGREAALRRVAAFGDTIMLATLLGSALATLAVGMTFNTFGLALAGAGLILALGGAGYLTARGTPLSGYLLTACNAAMVMLQIQAARGSLEYHFGVFVLLGVLLVYRDWRPLVFAAGLFAVHHLLFDRLQALDLGVYCTPSANLGRTLLHAVYVVIQTGVEIVMARQLRLAAVESAELQALIARIGVGQQICLDVAAMPVSAPTAVALQGAVARMHAAMAEVREAVGVLEAAAGEIAQGNMDLSERTERQAGSVQQTAASVDEISSAVQSSAHTAEEAARLAGSATTSAVDGGEVVGRMVSTMDDISAATGRIHDVIALIDGIAMQTTLLSLNAAVEAARAGEHGRGFAVVAGEVQALAERSRQSTKEIRDLLGRNSACIEAGVRLAGAAQDGAARVIAQAQRVSQLVSDMSVTSAQQSTGVQQIGVAVAALDVVTQQNAALVEEGAAAAASLRSQAGNLSAVVRQFRLSGGL